MNRKTIVVLAASVAMALAVAGDALAQRGSMGGGGGGGGGGGSGGGSFGGGGGGGYRGGGGGAAISAPSAGVRGPSAGGTFRGPGVAGTTRYSGGNWSGRHHRHHHHRGFVGAPYFYGAYAAYDACYQSRRVLTPWGWQWQRVYVCNDPYYYY